MDVADRAAVVTEAWLDSAVLRARRNAAGWSAAALAGPQPCSDCGEGIPDARRRALPGVERCVDCQEERERCRP